MNDNMCLRTYYNPREQIHIIENKLNNVGNVYDGEYTNYRKSSQTYKQKPTETPPPTYESGSETSCTNHKNSRFKIAKSDDTQLYIKIGETNPVDRRHCDTKLVKGTCDVSKSNSTTNSIENGGKYKSDQAAGRETGQTDNEYIYASSSNRSLINYDNGSHSQIDNV